MQSFLTLGNIEMALLTFLAICWALSMILSARSSLKKAREESGAPLAKVQEEQRRMEKQMEGLETRVYDMEHRLSDYGDKMTLVLRSQLSILAHLVNGNSIDKLRQSLQEINDYLINR
ncbi:MAG: hypothetical protein IJ719_09940 [Clostridia bacterium]|nr:hypothetical protein [Clostridia bacterium]